MQNINERWSKCIDFFFFLHRQGTNVFYFVSLFLHADSGSSLKIQESLNSYNALVDLQKINELLRKKNEKMENENNALQKEISETREEKSKLEDEIVERDEELHNLRYDTLL